MDSVNRRSLDCDSITVRDQFEALGREHRIIVSGRSNRRVQKELFPWCLSTVGGSVQCVRFLPRNFFSACLTVNDLVSFQIILRNRRILPARWKIMVKRGVEIAEILTLGGLLLDDRPIGR